MLCAFSKLCDEALNNTARITKCKHTFCNDCIEKWMETYDSGDENLINDQRPDPGRVSKPCPTCHQRFKYCHTYLWNAFMPEQPVASDDLQKEICVGLKRLTEGINDSDEHLPDLLTLMSESQARLKLFLSAKIGTVPSN